MLPAGHLDKTNNDYNNAFSNAHTAFSDLQSENTYPKDLQSDQQ